MTTLDVWWDPVRYEHHFRVNGCLHTKITDHEARLIPAYAYGDEAQRRVTPMVWHAMPSHDPAYALTTERT